MQAIRKSPVATSPAVAVELVGKPDLYGTHLRSSHTWLIEAKAARRLYKPKRTKVVAQLAAGGLALGAVH
jgi:hypothetical protein